MVIWQKIDDWEEEEKEKEKEKKDDLLTCVASPQVKSNVAQDVAAVTKTSN